MAQSVLFDYEVNDFDDVRDHLDALWSEFNQLIGILNTIPPVCGDPPDTCGASNLQAKMRYGKGGKKGGGKGKKAKGPARQAKR